MLESRTFFRVGGTQPIKVDVRVLAATNRSLRDAVALGEFRDDLYYRLNVLNIYLPPLRERREDIPLLVRRFIRELAREHDRTFRGITPEAMQRLVTAPWPGNVRQLRNLIESHGGAGARAPRSGRPTSRPTSWTGRAACCRSGSAARPGRDGPGGQELEFILRSLLDLKLQVEELRRRLDEHPQRVQVIELGDHASVADVADRRRRRRRRPGGGLPERDDHGRGGEGRHRGGPAGSTGGTAAGRPKCWGSGSGPCTGKSKPIIWNDLAREPHDCVTAAKFYCIIVLHLTSY